MRNQKSEIEPMIRSIFIIVLLLIMGAAAHAQLPHKRARIVTNDGNEFIGALVEENDQQLVLETRQFGRVTIQKMDIRKREDISELELKGGEYWAPNPQATRYFWAPNGYGLKKGEGYYQNVWVLFNQASVGITDRFSVGVGTLPLFLFSAGVTPVWLTPKVSIPLSNEKVNLGVGALTGTVFGTSNSGFGIVYGVTTVGNRDKNFTLGLGYGYAGGELANYPAVTFSSMIRTSRRGYFITENYFLSAGDDTVVLLSAGGRRVFNQVGLDFGLFVPFVTGLDSFVALPWLGVSVPFGKR